MNPKSSRGRSTTGADQRGGTSGDMTESSSIGREHRGDSRSVCYRGLAVRLGDVVRSSEHYALLKNNTIDSSYGVSGTATSTEPTASQLSYAQDLLIVGSVYGSAAATTLC